MVRCFKRLIQECYWAEDRKRGWIKSKGRDGRVSEFPLVSISLGILGVYEETSVKELGEQAAHLKKYAKSIPGNTFVRDRRSKAQLEGMSGNKTEFSWTPVNTMPNQKVSTS